MSDAEANPKPREVALEDLFVGQRFEGGPFTLGEDEIVRFARDYDPQYFHVDPEAAQSSMFGGLVASGWHTAALSIRALLEGETRFLGGLVGVSGCFRWPRPVRPGDALRIEAEVTKITPTRNPGRGVVDLTIVAKNQNGEEVQILTANLVVFSRGAAQG